jgi:two-component sensor histidine kinase
LTSWFRPTSDPSPNRDAEAGSAAGSSLPLRARLFLTVTIALFPIAIVSILQGMERARIDIENVRDRLVQSARIAASDEENVLASSEQILRALSNIDAVRKVTTECNNALADALVGVRFATNIARIDPYGVVVCSADPRGRGVKVSDLALFQSSRGPKDFTVSGQMLSRAQNTPVIGTMLALRDATGQFQGTVSLGVNIKWLDGLLRARNLPKGAVVAVFDRTGTIIATNRLDVARMIFAGTPSHETLKGGVQSALDAGGDRWTFAAAPLVGNNVFVGFSMRQARLFGPTYLRALLDFLLPIFMIGLAWLAIWLATERQVNQWIGYLRRCAEAYRGGHYGLRPSLDSAPAEFRMLGSAMQDMAEGIQQRDTRLRDAIAQKTLLIRETHHRVKNNLQIVMSLLSLQASQSRDSGVREALNTARARINALALVHRILHEVEDQTTVDLPRMLKELSDQIVGAMAAEGSDIRIDVDVLPRQVPGEIAVPLALFTVEALTNIFKHAFPRTRMTGTIRVSLQDASRGNLRLAIEDDGVGFSETDRITGTGDRLLGVFGRQIRGIARVESNPGRGTLVELVFADPDVAGEGTSAIAAA